MDITLTLTQSEATSLREKLGWLMKEANGVDIWLAPGGTLDVNGDDASTECFLDCDEEAHFNLGTILQKLGGDFTPHRTSGFHTGTAGSSTPIPDTAPEEVSTVTVPIELLTDVIKQIEQLEQLLKSSKT